jgi:hypothetical protein
LVEDVVFEHFQAGTSSGVFLAGIETVSWLELPEIVFQWCNFPNWQAACYHGEMLTHHNYWAISVIDNHGRLGQPLRPVVGM